METLKINQILELGGYVLEDKNGKPYQLVLRFLDMPQPKTGDTIVFFEDGMLDNKSKYFVQPYVFTVVDKSEVLQNQDFALAKIGGKKFALKRLYG